MTSERDAGRRFDEGMLPRLVIALGVLLFLVYVGEMVLLYEDQPFTSEPALVGFFVAIVFILPLIGGGHLLGQSDLPPKRYPRIGKWTVGGLGFFVSINLPVMAVLAFDDLAFRISWSRWAASVGAAGGLLVGFIEARAIQRELEAQRAAIRAGEAENQRRWFDYLNGLLRHEVLNTTNVIAGYASLLLEDDDVDDPVRTHLETIHRQSQEMTDVIKDVRVLIEATHDEADLRSKDLVEVLTTEIERLCGAYDSVTVETSLPDRLPVLADDLLPRLFANLLRNAVQHNDAECPRVRVTAERTGDTVRVRVADNGPGVPDDERPTLFERSDNTGANHGLGLYLVRTVAERYGGAVELTETGDEGSTFTVELPTPDRDEETGDDQAVASPDALAEA